MGGGVLDFSCFFKKKYTYTIIVFHVSAVQFIHVCPKCAQGEMVNCCKKFIISVKLTANTAARQSHAAVTWSQQLHISFYFPYHLALP